MIARRLTVVTRIIGAIFFGYLGLRAGLALAEDDHGLVRLLFQALTPLGFAAFGAIVTPFVLLPLLRRFQEWAMVIRHTQLILGTIGLLAGLLVGALLTPALVTLPGIGGLIAPFVVSFVLGILGVAITLGREEEFSEFISRYIRSGGSSSRNVVVDTSAIIDGRISDVAATGFLQGDLIIPRFILDELRHIADSADAVRRNRGRRGLDVLSRLQKERTVSVRVIEDDFPEARDVDSKLIMLSKKLRAPILTNDYNLHRVAELEEIRVLNVNSLANAVKVIVLPGEEMEVRIIQEGKESGQGVGFLDDGTMVVVEGGRRYLNTELNVVITRVLPTTAGRMIFAQPKGI